MMIDSDNLYWLAASWGRIKFKVERFECWNLGYLSNCAEWVGAYMSVDGNWSIQACSLAQGEWGSVWQPGVHGGAWVRRWQHTSHCCQAIVLAILAKSDSGAYPSRVDPTLARYGITCAFWSRARVKPDRHWCAPPLFSSLPEAWGMPHRHSATLL